MMEVEQLFSVQRVYLTVSLEKIISKHGLRVLCSKCCEEITNEREIIIDGITFCRSCAGKSYFSLLSDDQSVEEKLPEEIGFYKKAALKS